VKEAIFSQEGRSALYLAAVGLAHLLLPCQGNTSQGRRGSGFCLGEGAPPALTFSASLGREVFLPCLGSYQKKNKRYLQAEPGSYRGFEDRQF